MCVAPTVFTRDTTGLLTEVEDALGRVTRFTYDDRRLPESMEYPDGRRVEMVYDDVGNLVELRVPSRDVVGEAGEAHGFGWSSFHGMTMYLPPGVDGETPAAVSTRRVYDLARRLVRLERPDGRDVDVIWSGDRLSRVESGDEVWVHTQEEATGLPASIAGPHDNALAFDWHGPLPAAVTWTSDAGGAQGRLSWAWGADLVPTSETVTDLVGRSVTLPLTYDADLLPTGIGPLTLTRHAQRGSVTALTLGSATSQQAHTPFGELDTHATQVGGQSRYSATHTRDAIGRITEMVETVWRGGVLETTTFTYHYDTAGRLESVDEDGVEAWRWQWDGNSNRIGAMDALNPAGEIVPADVEIDAQDRLMRYGDETFAYNLNAEMVSRTVGSEVTTYGWSVFGNLEQVMLPDGTEIAYELDPTGRRVGRSVDGQRTHGWLYRDHLNPVAQLDAEGRLEQVYLYGSQPHVPDAILQIGAGGSVVATYRVVTYVRGSVRLVVNASTGAVAQELRYSPFGEVLHDSNPGFQPFGFAGGLWDTDTGLVRFGAREYDARLGRWLSRDPILFDGGDPNLFGYVLGDPVNWVDPEGLEGTAVVYRCTGPIAWVPGFRHAWLQICGLDPPDPRQHGADCLYVTFWLRGSTLDWLRGEGWDFSTDFERDQIDGGAGVRCVETAAEPECVVREIDFGWWLPYFWPLHDCQAATRAAVARCSPPSWL